MNATPRRFSAAPTILLWVLTTLVVGCGGRGASAPARVDTPRSDLRTIPTDPVSSAGRSGTPPDAQPANATPADTARTAPEASPRAPTALDAPIPAPELPRGTTVLHIGDSFAGALGIDLNVELKAAGVRGILRYETATYIPTWAFGKELDKYLGQFNPDLVLVTLGANELEIPDPAQRIPTIHRLVARLGGRPCVWVGAPLWKGARPALLDTIREACAPCVYLDSSALVPELPRARDHIHPSIEARKTWAKAVLGWLASHRARAGSRPWELTL